MSLESRITEFEQLKDMTESEAMELEWLRSLRRSLQIVEDMQRLRLAGDLENSDWISKVEREILNSLMSAFILWDGYRVDVDGPEAASVRAKFNSGILRCQSAVLTMHLNRHCPDFWNL